MCYAILTTRVIFMAKCRFDVVSLRREHVWAVLGDRICEMKRVTRVRTARDQNPRLFLLYFDPW